ncbi:calcium-binding protein [Rubellimicrobium rubrum]|uniref:Calcium-binding protein n=1 Tax=Rubellimicrobium rubrum TaxID=2585369 RepID=A0A5C4N0E5_9RHOB|nr:CAP domain-containing protein [Rubellimicrobium rubrum]TNC50716.1 calcium-binding protein [Rubellimicrobium rubrum]
MANVQISAQEQLVIELLNRARLDPAAEAARYGIGLNDGLSSGSISSAPKAPLAWNADLGEASALHSEWMLATDTFSHTGANGSSSSNRMATAGYSFSGSWSAGENISWRGTTGSVDATGMALEQHKGLFLSAGHRVNILGDFREVGVGQELGGFTRNGVTYNSSMVTENFAKSGTRAFVTGVAFQDRDGDGFYDVGEGTGSVTFDWLGNTGNAVNTGSAGGYGLAIPTGLSGTATVAVTSNGSTQQAVLAMTGTNVKLDLINGSIIAASTDLTLGSGAKDGRLLGMANIDLTGNTSANRLEGNKGANDIFGGGGSDTLLGAAGNDRLEGAWGNDSFTGGSGSDSFVFKDLSGSTTGQDRIADLGSGDRIVIDLMGSLPSEAAWEDSHISAATGGFTIALDDGSQIFVASTTLSTLENALTLI